MEKEIKLVPLELHNQEHLNLMFVVRTHPEVAKHLIQCPPDNFDTHIQYLHRVLNSSAKNFYIICSQKNLCGYCHVNFLGKTLELGWALHPDWWGKGIGKSSVLLLVQLLQNSGLADRRSLILSVKKDNTRALSLYKKCGFVILSESENQEYLMQYMP
jgi:RimJ/RimL family protein N-acetyltransferase